MSTKKIICDEYYKSAIELITVKAKLKQYEDMQKYQVNRVDCINHCFNVLTQKLQTDMRARIPAKNGDDLAFIRDTTAFIHTIQDIRRQLLNENTQSD